MKLIKLLYIYIYFFLLLTEHGSLTIVRRSNSRKNFTQIDPQAPSIGSPGSSSISFFQTPISETLAERLGATRGTTSNGSGASGSGGIVGDKRAIDNNSGYATGSVGKMQPSSPNPTNFVTDNVEAPRVDRATIDYRSSRDTLDYQMSLNPLDNQLPQDDKMSAPSTATHSNQSLSGTWETDTLPPVDTPDALNKAAVR